jgi:acetoin utilization protein AcuB
MRSLTVGDFMTRAPHTIGSNQPLELAHKLMNEHGIRHLPVLETGKLVGVVSQRDLHFIETLRDVDPRAVRVAEAMAPEVLTVTARTTLRTVALAMVDRKIGSAVVVDGKRRVIGMFTTIDALRALAEMTAAVRAPPRRRARSSKRRAA